MSITHEQAQKLIQRKMDQRLGVEETATLSAHLHRCRECMAYASEIQEITHMLPSMMKRQWSVYPVPLSIGTLIEKRKKLPASNLLTIRMATVSLVVVALFFTAWQFVLLSPSPSGQLSSVIPPMPTPSHLTAQSISTQLTLENCVLMLYTVQKSDTLAGIAEQFSVPEQTIADLNHLEPAVVHDALELMIPVCGFTPTGTFHAATFTTTLTPVLNFRTSTPGG